MKILKFSKKKQKEVLTFLDLRFEYLRTLRAPFDDKIIVDVELANDIDENQQPYDENTRKGKKWWEQIGTVPYIYTIIQTMVARLIQVFFGKQNYLRIYVEDPAYAHLEEDLQRWVQYELDKLKFKARARDYLEDALIQRTTWLRLRPETKEGKMEKVEFDVYTWFDVWFDTKAIRVEDSDFFCRRIVPLWQIKKNKFYINTEEIENTIPPEEIAKRQEYREEVFESKHADDKSIRYYDPEKNNVTDEVEVMEYLGVYDKSIHKDNPDVVPVIFTWANRTLLIGIQEVDYETVRKKYIFAMRPARQANSLVGKSIPQIVGKLQNLLNEVFALTIQNFKLQIKLLFKYKDDAGIDLSDLYAGAGNAVAYDESPNDVDIFDVKNMIEAGMAVISWIIQFMQQTTGAVDYLMGTSAGRGTTETASGIKTITEQAMFKFQMMAENVYSEKREFIKYLIILWATYNPEKVLALYPKLKDYFNLTPEMMEESNVIDIGLNDLTLRRDAERTTFVNGANVIIGMLEKVQGDVPEFLRQFMKALEMGDAKIEKIMKGAKNPSQLAAIQKAIAAAAGQGGGAEAQQKGGSTKANPQADNQAVPEEEANNTTPKAAETL